MSCDDVYGDIQFPRRQHRREKKKKSQKDSFSPTSFPALNRSTHLSLPHPLGRSQKQLLMSRGIASVKDYYRKEEKKR
jgi:hypothetical protein